MVRKKKVAKAPKTWLEKRRYFSVIGIIVGCGVSMLFKKHTPSLDLSESDFWQLNSTTLINKLYSSWENITPVASRYYNLDASSAVNVTAHYPVVMIPGFTSTGLEIWNGAECGKQFFRQRIWGTTLMFRQFMMNQKCWLQHLMMNSTTGLDPDGVKLRAAQGLEAADYIVAGYYVWGRIIENLAEIGYDNNNMFLASYDWRLSPELLQERDSYFLKLQKTIEVARISNKNRKVVLITHSYAAQVLVYFMNWVESPNGGNAGTSWFEDNVGNIVNIAGPMFGVPKAIGALLSGEMKDTAELGTLSVILEKFFTPAARAALSRSWTSVQAMMPLGGNAIWGNATTAPDETLARAAPDVECNVSDIEAIKEHTKEEGSQGVMLQFSDDASENRTAAEIPTILGKVDKTMTKLEDRFQVNASNRLQSTNSTNAWINPLLSPLPNAPSLKMFCMYGIGISTERGYIFKRNPEYKDFTNATSTTEQTEQCAVDGSAAGQSIPYILDTEYNKPPWIRAGIRYTEGDGTVPLTSLGYMCAKGWKHNALNPGNAKIIIREHVHNPVSVIYDARGGPATADHVDILGNLELIKSILNIAGGREDLVPEEIHSDIKSISENIHL